MGWMRTGVSIQRVAKATKAKIQNSFLSEAMLRYKS